MSKHHRLFRPRLTALAAVVAGSALLLASHAPVYGQTPAAPPAPNNVGTTVPLPYNGANATQVNPSLVGPIQLLRSGTMDFTDPQAPTITIPLYLGHMRDGTNVWYILTDTDDKGNSEQLGLNYSAKLTYSSVGKAVRSATIDKTGNLTFEKGTVDFSPARNIVPGDAPNFFPPKSMQPGSVGDADYTPMIRIENAGGHIYDAPVIAMGVGPKALGFCDGNPDYSIVHDRVAKICPDQGTVTIKLTPIFTFTRPALYMSMDASDPLPAALDAATFAPAMADIPVGHDDGAFSALERLFVVANGPTGADNPQRQGLNSALGDGKLSNGADRPPLNVIGGIPNLTLDYSPLWDLNLAEWTQNAIDLGYRSRITDEFQFLGLARDGWITGPMGKPFGSTGLIVNCPVVFRYE